MRLVERPLVEPARVFPLEDLGAKVPPDGVVALVAQDGRHDEHHARKRKVHQARAAQRAHDEQQRIPRQKGHDHHTGFHKHDQEQQRVHPHAVALHERLQVFVYVQNEIDQKGHYFHERALRGWGEEVESSAHYPHHPAIKSPWGRRLKSGG